METLTSAAAVLELARARVLDAQKEYVRTMSRTKHSVKSIDCKERLAAWEVLQQREAEADRVAELGVAQFSQQRKDSVIRCVTSIVSDVAGLTVNVQTQQEQGIIV